MSLDKCPQSRAEGVQKSAWVKSANPEITRILWDRAPTNPITALNWGWSREVVDTTWNCLHRQRGGNSVIIITGPFQKGACDTVLLSGWALCRALLCWCVLFETWFTITPMLLQLSMTNFPRGCANTYALNRGKFVKSVFIELVLDCGRLNRNFHYDSENHCTLMKDL